MQLANLIFTYYIFFMYVGVLFLSTYFPMEEKNKNSNLLEMNEW